MLDRLLKPALDGEKPRNAFIYGITGTGKTCVTKKVIAQFRGKERADAIYVNARIFSSRYKVFQQIGRALLPELDKLGFGFAFIYQRMVEYLDSRQKQLIVVVDEMDSIKDLDQFVYSLIRMNDEMDNGGITLVGISNRLLLKSTLDPRTKSSLFEKEMVFRPYNAIQLKDILTQRAALAFNPGAVDESALSLVAAMAAKEGGDARFALSLLRTAAEIAEERGETVVKEEHVNMAKESVEEEALREVIGTLPYHQQILLFAVAKLWRGRDLLSPVISGEVYKQYMKLCMELNEKPRSDRWLRDYFTALEKIGLLKLEDTGKGMRGHSQIVRLTYSPSRIEKILGDILCYSNSPI